jgi:hypothetical protein
MERLGWQTTHTMQKHLRIKKKIVLVYVVITVMSSENDKLCSSYMHYNIKYVFCLFLTVINTRYMV